MGVAANFPPVAAVIEKVLLRNYAGWRKKFDVERVWDLIRCPERAQ